MTESKHILRDAPSRGRIEKQIRLPLSKAVEISLKSLKVRFWRSMLTVSSIILAIAFLTYVLGRSRVESAVAVGVRDESRKALDASRAMDEAWTTFERALSQRFAARRGDYKREMDYLYAGRTERFKDFCAEAAKDPSDRKSVV